MQLIFHIFVDQPGILKKTLKIKSVGTGLSFNRLSGINYVTSGKLNLRSDIGPDT